MLEMKITRMALEMSRNTDGALTPVSREAFSADSREHMPHCVVACLEDGEAIRTPVPKNSTHRKAATLPKHSHLTSRLMCIPALYRHPLLNC